MAEAWYKDGLRFRCIGGCTKCCHERGFVTVTEDEVRRIRAYLKDDSPEFEKHFGRVAGYYLIQVNEFNGCPFRTESGCSIYDVRPAQCSSFPWWTEYLQSEGDWTRFLSRCPGGGIGELHSEEEIKKRCWANPLRRHGL